MRETKVLRVGHRIAEHTINTYENFGWTLTGSKPYGEYGSMTELVFVRDNRMKYYSQLDRLFQEYLSLDKQLDKMYNKNSSRAAIIGLLSGIAAGVVIGIIAVNLLFHTNFGSDDFWPYALGIVIGFAGAAAVGLSLGIGLNKKFDVDKQGQIADVKKRMQEVRQEASQYL